MRAAACAFSAAVARLVLQTLTQHSLPTTADHDAVEDLPKNGAGTVHPPRLQLALVHEAGMLMHLRRCSCGARSLRAAAHPWSLAVRSLQVVGCTCIR
jgi:hypothetical protein